MKDILAKVTALAKRRGFIYPSCEIYGGLANSYDYGPYGTEMKENIRKVWGEKFVQNRDDMYGIDSSIILNPKVWSASGHVENFADIMIEDVKTNERYRADHIIEEYFQQKGEEIKVEGKSVEELNEIIKSEKIKSPKGNELGEARKFSTLFETKIGILEDSKSLAYLRGEIAQGIFINYKNILDSMHPKLPFGIAQAGKAFRNEITKGQLTYRTLEFDLMEFEYFFDPNEQKWEELFEYWRKEVWDYAVKIGLDEAKLRWRRHEEHELSHYSTRTDDLEYKFDWGYKEIGAIAYRTDFDLRNHEKHSGVNMEYITPDGKRIRPHVIEPTFGLSRQITAILIDAYNEEMVKGKVRTYLKLSSNIAPVKYAIFPLQKDEKLQDLAKQIHADLKAKVDGILLYDNTGNIGKNYRRQDEIGTPYCITVDYESLENQTVTIRERDSMKQKRVKIDEIVQDCLREKSI